MVQVSADADDGWLGLGSNTRAPPKFNGVSLLFLYVVGRPINENGN